MAKRSGVFEGGGVWNMAGVAGARCEHCRSLLSEGDQGGPCSLVEVTDDLFTAFDFNEQRVEPTAKRVCRTCVRGLNFAGRRNPVPSEPYDGPADEHDEPRTYGFSGGEDFARGT